MSDQDQLDGGKASPAQLADRSRGDETGRALDHSRDVTGGIAGRQTSVGSNSSDGIARIAESRAFFTQAVSAARAELGKLAVATAAVDFSRAVASTTVLQGHLRTARSHVKNALARDAQAIHLLAELESDVKTPLAKAPIMSAEALASPEKWNQEAEAWRAKCRGDRPATERVHGCHTPPRHGSRARRHSLRCHAPRPRPNRRPRLISATTTRKSASTSSCCAAGTPRRSRHDVSSSRGCCRARSSSKRVTSCSASTRR